MSESKLWTVDSFNEVSAYLYIKQGIDEVIDLQSKGLWDVSTYCSPEKLSLKINYAEQNLNATYKQLDEDNLVANDAEGISPLCFLSQNNIYPELAIAIANKYDSLNEEPRAASKACDKGKTPMQYACMSAGEDLIKALTGTPFKFQIYTNDNPPVPIQDEWDVYTVEYSITHPVSITKQNILSASSIPKPDLLKIFANIVSVTEKNMWYYPDNDSWSKDIEDPFDKYGNTPLIMATRAQCYESCKLILARVAGYEDFDSLENDENYNKNETTLAIAYTNKEVNGEVESADSICTELGDEGLKRLYRKYYNGYFAKLVIAMNLLYPPEVVANTYKDLFDIEGFSILKWHEGSEEHLLYKKVMNYSLLSYIEEHFSSDAFEQTKQNILDGLSNPEFSAEREEFFTAISVDNHFSNFINYTKEVTYDNDGNEVNCLNEFLTNYVKDENNPFQSYFITNQDLFEKLPSEWISNPGNIYLNKNLNYIDLGVALNKDWCNDACSALVNSFVSEIPDTEPVAYIANMVNGIVDANCTNILSSLGSANKFHLLDGLGNAIEMAAANKAYIETAITNYLNNVRHGSSLKPEINPALIPSYSTWWS